MTHPDNIATIGIAKINKKVADMIRHEALSGQTAYALLAKSRIYQRIQQRNTSMMFPKSMD